MYKMMRSLALAAQRLGVPSGCAIELLAPCNLRCPHCYVSHDAKNRLTFEVIDDLLQSLAELGTFSLTLTGGEIGLRRDLFEILERARAHRFAIYLLSSGTRWGPAEWDRLAELGVSSVRVSLYGTTPCVHEAVTLVEGSHARTVATIDGLLERGIDVAISTPIMSANAGELGEVIGYARERGCSITMDPNITVMDSGDAAPKATLATREQLVAMYSDPTVRDFIGEIVADSACSVPDGDQRPCGTGDSLFVRCTGEVFPCAVWPTSAGNILETPVIDIWRHSPVFQQARALVNATLPTCSSCGDRSLCGPCAAMNLQDAGDLAVPSPTVCETTAARAIGVRGYSDQPHRGTPHRRLPIVA